MSYNSSETSINSCALSWMYTRNYGWNTLLHLDEPPIALPSLLTVRRGLRSGLILYFTTTNAHEIIDTNSSPEASITWFAPPLRRPKHGSNASNFLTPIDLYTTLVPCQNGFKTAHRQSKKSCRKIDRHLAPNKLVGTATGTRRSKRGVRPARSGQAKPRAEGIRLLKSKSSAYGCAITTRLGLPSLHTWYLASLDSVFAPPSCFRHKLSLAVHHFYLNPPFGDSGNRMLLLFLWFCGGEGTLWTRCCLPCCCFKVQSSQVRLIW